jgi:nucleotidyltransferase/DNA polymerase involved in DNA repair
MTWEKKSDYVIDKLWGIGKKTSQKLGKLGIRSFADVVQMDTEYIAKKVGRPSDELDISKHIARSYTHDFLEIVTRRDIPIAWKTWGVSLEQGLYLVTSGIRDVGDIREDTEIITDGLPPRLISQLKPLKPQTELALVQSLTSKDARYLVTRGDFSSLSDLAASSSSEVRNIIDWVPTSRIKTWIENAKLLLNVNIRDYHKASNLPLKREIRGVGPEMVAFLYSLGIRHIQDLSEMDDGIREKYFPWIYFPFSQGKCPVWAREHLFIRHLSKLSVSEIRRYSRKPHTN